MDLAEYEHMEKVYNYVFSVPPGAERDKRLAEISERDSDKLWDFYSGLLSGRIKKPEIISEESEESSMNNEKRIKSYQEFVQAWGKTSHYHQLAEFHRSFPEVYEAYKQRMEKERLKAKDPVSYYLRYGGNLTAKEV